MTPERHEFANDSDSDSSVDSDSSSSCLDEQSPSLQRQIYVKPQYRRPIKTSQIKIGVTLAKRSTKS